MIPQGINLPQNVITERERERERGREKGEEIEGQRETNLYVLT